MHKRIGKAITGSLLAATMLATTAASFVPMTMTASAGSCVGQSDFNDGVGLPWHTCETNPAKQTFNISNGTYNVTIVNPGGATRGGNSRWDLQFRHRKLKIQSGHTYKIHWEVTASNAGDLATHIASLDGESQVAWHNNASDFGQGWSNVTIAKGKNSFDSTFTSTETIEVAEWAFHYGGQGQWQDHDCFPEGTTLSFDNMTLECVTCGDKAAGDDSCNWDSTNEMGVITARSDVRINQVGYFTKLNKVASYATDNEIKTPVSFEILDSTGKSVYTGTGKSIGKDTDSGQYIQQLDFSDFNTAGSGYTIVVDDKTNVQTNEKTGITYDMYISHPFAVADTVYDGLLTDALNYYYQNRSGIAITTDYITSGDKATLAHNAGHNPDTAYVQSEWVKSYAGIFDGDKTYTIDGTGGWYDAGDHGKYVVNGGISVWTLQNMYERSLANDTYSKFYDGETMSIPENTNGTPDILDESRVELEWMFKMIVSSKDPYWGKYEGLVYHKLHDHKWTGLACKPDTYAAEWETTRIVKPPSFAATLNLAACAAQAARLWKGIDDDFAAECLANAKKCYAAVEKYYYDYKETEADNTTSLYAPLDQAIGGGAYGDTYVKDDMYWAACELYATTGDSAYYDDLSTYQNTDADDKAFSLTTNLSGGENNGSFSSFNWGCTAGLGTLSLYLNEDKLTTADKTKVDNAIVAAADEYIAVENAQGMGLPYQSADFEDAVNIGAGITVHGYEWGSNSFVVNNAIVMAYAYDVSGKKDYIDGVSTAMDYVFGRNGLGVSYVTGYGTYHTSNPHHRLWSHELDPAFPMAPAGVLSGGAGSGLQDPYVAGLGYDRTTTPPQLCYVDSIEAWSVNEVTINWNAPFAWVVSFLEDEAPKVEDTTEGDILWGDANVDGDVKISDAILILQNLADPETYPITAQGQINADVFLNGDGINAQDALSIQKLLANQLTELPESYQ